jgi:hypothetical protein
MWLSVARRLRKEAGSFGGEFVRRQSEAGGEQPMVCPGVVVRHGAVGKQVSHVQMLRYSDNRRVLNFDANRSSSLYAVRRMGGFVALLLQ